MPPASPTSSAPPGPPLAINPMFAANQPNLSTARGGGGRGGAWGGRGRGGQGGDSRRGVGKSWLADRPVRCPNEAPPGSFCGFPNYQEAEKCGKCRVKNPYHKILEPKSNPPPNYQEAEKCGKCEE